MLSKLGNIDPDGAHFGLDGAVQATIHQVPVLMYRGAEDCLDILVPRSFARSVEEWIEDACREFMHEST